MKIAILLTHMGDDAVDVFSTFSEEKETFDKTILLFDKYCIPNINYAIETYILNSIS